MAAPPLRCLPGNASPAQIAETLKPLGGLVWLDSAQTSEGSVSLLTAAPERILTGCIDRDWHQIESLIAHEKHTPTPDWPFPTGGLFGWVGYDGQFTFGLYRSILHYDHDHALWYQYGPPLLDPTCFHQPLICLPATAPQPFLPTIDQAAFSKQVRRAQDYIAAGDIYQVNLAYPWQTRCPCDISSLSLYHHLRHVSPAPHAAFLDLDGTEVLSASPELFLRLSGQKITTRPIKGTRPRFPQDPRRDILAREELLHCEKERAELLMITDLERNDLGQVCEFGTVTVPELWQIEAYPQVYHLVSTVTGKLPVHVSHARAFRSCFPGGSITGAPKKRAREIIAELEPHPRGLYTGAIGGFGFNGESLWNIAIRTAVRQGEDLHFHTGSGIVADSLPEREYQETLHKAAGLRMIAAAAAP